MRKMALLLNCVLALALVVMLVLGFRGSYFIFALMVSLLLISSLTFAKQLPGRHLLGLCGVGNAVGSVLMGLTLIPSLLIISRPAALSLVFAIFLIYTGVQMYSASVAFKLWKIARKEGLA